MKISAILLALLSVFSVKPSYEVGDVVKDFSLRNTDKRMVSLSDYKNEKGIILIFDCNTCPYSKMYNERIIGLNQKYKSKGFPVITINANDPTLSPGDSFEEMVNIAKTKGYEFPYLQDETQAVARNFGATNTPHVFVLKREGSDFKVAYIGAIDNNTRDANAATKKYVEDAVDALIDNKPITTQKTKAIGCGIKFRNS